MTTIEKILDVPRFSDLKLLNKDADLSREIETIEISETPDVSGYLPKHSLLLTTGMAFQDDPQGLCDLISSLDSLPTAGLAIKLGRFISELDPIVLEHASKLHFPILQIPVSKTLGDISHQLLSYIWDNHTELMYFALDIQRKFSNMMMKGATANALVNHLSSLIKRPILLFNPFGDIQEKSHGFNVNDYLNKALLAELKDDIIEIQKNPQTTSFIKDIRENEKLLITIYPIGTDHFYPHVLVILKSDQFPYPFSQLAIEQAISVLSFTIYKDRILSLNKKASKKEFFSKLIDERIDSNTEITNWTDYGNLFGVVDSSNYQVVLGEITIPKDKEYHSEEIEALVYEWFNYCLSNYLSDAILLPTQNNREFVLLLQKKNKDLENILQSIHNEIYEKLNIPLRFGVGNAVSSITLIRFSYGEASESLKDNQHLKEKFVFFYENEGINSLLQSVSENDIHYFCSKTLGTLAYPKNENDKELRKTLHVYLNNQCRITETADELFIHRNTVKYRIGKCEQLFQGPIDDPELSIQLRVALMLSTQKKNSPS